MVTTPWYDHEIPMTEAAEIGTRKVIAEHSTIGVVITTDGTISDIPREDYLEAEERVIRQLQELGKPFIVLLNSADPKGERAGAIARDITSRYEVNCMAVNCLELDEDAVPPSQTWKRPTGPAPRYPSAITAEWRTNRPVPMTISPWRPSWQSMRTSSISPSPPPRRRN